MAMFDISDHLIRNERKNTSFIERVRATGGSDEEVAALAEEDLNARIRYVRDMLYSDVLGQYMERKFGAYTNITPAMSDEAARDLGLD